MESTAARMGHLGGSTLNRLPILSVDEIIERIDAVEVAELRELAAELFTAQHLSVAGVGPDEDAFRAAIEPLGATLAGTGEDRLEAGGQVSTQGAGR
jgi:hypothetical protein